MSAALLEVIGRRDRFGLKGPAAPQWLESHGIAVPPAPNSWSVTGNELLVARLGKGEFFLEDCEDGTTLRRIVPVAETHPPGVYPVLREDAAFALSGAAAADMLAQVCNVDFAALVLDERPVVMTLMTGVAVLVVPREIGGDRQYRIWCDPTFGRYLGETLERVVIEGGGIYKGAAG